MYLCCSSWKRCWCCENTKSFLPMHVLFIYGHSILSSHHDKKFWKLDTPTSVFVKFIDNGLYKCMKNTKKILSIIVKKCFCKNIYVLYLAYKIYNDLPQAPYPLDSPLMISSGHLILKLKYSQIDPDQTREKLRKIHARLPMSE